MNIDAFLLAADRISYILLRQFATYSWQSTIIIATALLTTAILSRLKMKYNHLLLVTATLLLPLLVPLTVMFDTLDTPRMSLPVIPEYAPKRLPSRQTSGDIAADSETSRVLPDGMNQSVLSNDSPLLAEHHHTGPRKLRFLTAYPCFWTVVIILGAFITVLFIFLRSVFRLMQLRRNATEITDPELCAIVSDIASEMQLNTPIRLFESPDTFTPLASGFFRKAIIFPQMFFDQYSENETREIIAHELAHIKRLDTITLPYASTVRTLLFYNPLAWILARRISLLAEQAADDYVVSLTGDPLSYARTLVNTLNLQRNRLLEMEMVAGLLFSRSVIHRRIRSILGYDKTGTHHITKIRALGLGILVIITFVIAVMSTTSEHIDTIIGDIHARFSEHMVVRRAEKYNATAYAIPLRGITVDGDISDWPGDMIRYPISNYGKVYGPSDIDTADLTKSADLSPSFMTGYDPDRNLLYLALIVRDDIVFAFQDTSETSLYDYPDACEIYLDGAHREHGVPLEKLRWNAADLPGMQYVMTATGTIYSKYIKTKDMSRNPTLIAGDIDQTKTKAITARHGDTTIYEWEIEVYDKYPDHPAKLAAGKTIGFDVAVLDRDSKTDYSSWGCWGPQGYLKINNIHYLGDIILLEDTSELGEVTGTVTDMRTGEPVFKQHLDIYHGDEIYTSVVTDSDGRYTAVLTEGRYSIRERGLSSAKHPFTIRPQSNESVNITVNRSALPDILVETLELYAGLDSYSDEVIMDSLPGPAVTRCSFSFKRPNLIRYRYTDVEHGTGRTIISDGTKISSGKADDDNTGMIEAPENLFVHELGQIAGQPDGGLVHQILMSRNPLQTIRQALLSAKVTGTDEINGKQMVTIELKLNTGNITTPIRTTHNFSITHNLWIGTEDNIIYQVHTDTERRYETSETDREGYVVEKVMKQNMTRRHVKVKMNPTISMQSFNLARNAPSRDGQ